MVEKEIIMAEIEDTEYEVLKALVDSKLSILERKDMARRYGAVCPKCGSDEVEWLEKLHDCEDCQVWAISCLECRCEWIDVVWKCALK